MRYIGSKKKLLEHILKIITSIQDIEIKTILDGFSGTATVADFLNTTGYQVSTCDIQYYSYILQYCKVKVNNKNLTFKNLEGYNSKEEVLEYFNNLNEEDLIEGFIYNNYCPTGSNDLDFPRLYFSDLNGKLIDTIRTKIGEWYQNKQINETEYMWLQGNLLESVSLVSNIAGVYGAYLKKLQKNALKRMVLINKFECNGNENNKCYNMDTLECIKNIKHDLCYFDPPYNTRQYCDNYHILETIAKYDNPKIKGKTGKRDTTTQKSKFSQKRNVKKEWDNYFKYCKSSYLLWSYSSDSLLSKKEILEIVNKYGELITFEEIQHKKFVSNNKTKNNGVIEYLILAKKDLNKKTIDEEILEIDEEITNDILCNHIFKKGKNKDNQCNKKNCKRHKKKIIKKIIKKKTTKVIKKKIIKKKKVIKKIVKKVVNKSSNYEDIFKSVFANIKENYTIKNINSEDNILDKINYNNETMKYIIYEWDNLYDQNNHNIFNYVLIPNDLDIKEDLKKLNLSYENILDFYCKIKFSQMNKK